MNRTLFLLLVSNAVASVGTGIAMIAVPWLLAQIDWGIASAGGGRDCCDHHHPQNAG